MSVKTYNVLFLCTGNSARSIMGEVLLNRLGKGRFRAYSAGSHPKGEVHPLALRLFEHMKLRVEGLRSKSWDEFAAPDSPPLDFVFTVCDSAAQEVSPMWPGQPMSAHCGMVDPAAVGGDERTRDRAFRAAYYELERRIQIFTQLPITSLDRMSLQRRVDEIGGDRGDAA